MNTAALPKEAVSMYNYALELSSKGKLDKALNEYQKAIEAYPAFIEAYNNMGEIYSQQGNGNQAITIYNSALEIERNYKVLLNLGVEHYNARDYQEALVLFLESVSLKPDFLEGNFYTGLVYYNQHNMLEAQKYLENVAELDCNHVKANYMLSFIYYELKEYQKVLNCLDRIKDCSVDMVFINKYYGFCYFHLGEHKKAADFLTTALKSSPRYNEFKKYLKELTYENKVKEIGDIDKAIKKLEKQVMKEKPAIHEITTLSMLYIFKGQNKQAEKLLLSMKNN